MEDFSREAHRELKRMFELAIDDVIAKTGQINSLKEENDLLYQTLHQIAHASGLTLAGRRQRSEIRALAKCKADASADFANREMHLRARVRTARFQGAEPLRQPRSILNPRKSAGRR